MNIDAIINMLHYEQPSEIQKQGIDLALQEEDLNFLLCYSEMPEYSHNCATIFTKLEHEKCAKYFDDLFSWIEDYNAPDALIIIDYLATVPYYLIYESLIRSMSACVKRCSSANAQTINMVISNNEKLIVSLIKNETKLYNEFLQLLKASSKSF